jgi:hypothetical protein
MNLKRDELLNFEWMPSELKDYIYSKYKLPCIYLKTLGTIDEDYVWIVVIYDDESEKLKDYSYSEIEKLLHNNIFQFFPSIKAGEILLDNDAAVVIEVFDQKQALDLLGYDENCT